MTGSHTMPSVLLRRFFGATLAAAIGLVPLVPPEHVHEIEDDHGHIEFVVHRHARAHALVEDADHHEQRQTADHQNPPIATLDQEYVVPAIAHLAAPARTATAILAEPTMSRRVGFAGFVERLIHGPPRAPTLQRGPPSLLSC